MRFRFDYCCIVAFFLAWRLEWQSHFDTLLPFEIIFHTKYKTRVPWLDCSEWCNKSYFTFNTHINNTVSLRVETISDVAKKCWVNVAIVSKSCLNATKEKCLVNL